MSIGARLARRVRGIQLPQRGQSEAVTKAHDHAAPQHAAQPARLAGSPALRGLVEQDDRLLCEREQAARGAAVRLRGENLDLAADLCK